MQQHSVTPKEWQELMKFLSPQEIAEMDSLLTQETNSWFNELCGSFDPTHSAFNNICDRQVLMQACTDSTRYREMELQRCKDDVAHWLTYWVWTYDPRLLPGSAVLPFVPWPHQVAYLRWRDDRIENRENGLIEKSRDSGLSWLNIAHQTHRWLFFPGWKGTIASRKESYVDRLGDPDSLLEKTRIILRYLPDWMRPAKYSEGFLKIINFDNGSTLTGETGHEIGRGGRSSAVDIDEAAFLEQADRIDAAVSQNAQVVFWTSTPKGKANLFAKKRFSGRVQVFRFHWTDDPRKNKDWYEKEKARLEPVVLAQEIDIDYDASDPDSYILSKWVAASDSLEMPECYSHKIAGLDIGLSGDRTVLVVRQGSNVIFCESWRGLDTTQSAFKAVEICRNQKISHLIFDADGVGAGVAGTLGAIENLDLKFYPIHGAGKPSNLWWPGERKRSHEKFANRRAEIWGILRQRLIKAYNLKESLEPVEPEDAIFFAPNLPGKLDIQAQLSMPRSRTLTNGKIQLESKREMAMRGIDSPDYADALCYAFAISPQTDSTEEPQVWGNRLSAFKGYK